MENYFQISSKKVWYSMNKLENKIDNFKNAVNRLLEAAEELKKDETNSVVRDGMIQRFEFTYELSWKTTKEYLEHIGIAGKTSPRSVIKEAYAQNLIEDEKSWLIMINDRNLTSHVYSERMAQEICSRIIEMYIKQFCILLNSLENEDLK